MRWRDVHQLDPRHIYWAPMVVAPHRDWAGAPGCRRGARYLLDADDCHPTRENVALFAERKECLEWMMSHRLAIRTAAPEAEVRVVNLAKWMLGLE